MPASPNQPPYGNTWAATLLPHVESRPALPPSHSNGSSSSNSSNSSSYGGSSSALPLLHHSTKEESWPLPDPPSVAPAFGLLLPGQSVAVRFNALREDAAKLRNLLLAGGPAAHHQEHEEESATGATTHGSSSSNTSNGHSSSNGSNGTNGGSGNGVSNGDGSTSSSARNHSNSGALTWASRCAVVKAWCSGTSTKLWYGVDALALRPEDDANAVRTNNENSGGNKKEENPLEAPSSKNGVMIFVFNWLTFIRNFQFSFPRMRRCNKEAPKLRNGSLKTSLTIWPNTGGKIPLRGTSGELLLLRRTGERCQT